MCPVPLPFPHLLVRHQTIYVSQMPQKSNDSIQKFPGKYAIHVQLKSKHFAFSVKTFAFSNFGPGALQ